MIQQNTYEKKQEKHKTRNLTNNERKTNNQRRTNIDEWKNSEPDRKQK